MPHDDKKKKNDPKPPVTDPLEAAKISAPPAPPPSAPKKEKPPAEVVPPEQVDVALAEIKPLPPEFEVIETTSVSLHGQIIRLNKGDKISAAGYGHQAMSIFKSANVPMRELLLEEKK